MTTNFVLEARGITKGFPGVLANDQVDFTLADGEIHCLLGENGAGKTTLMNVLYGLYHPDAGQIRMRGQPVSLHNPNDAVQRGIGMVHQHFMLIPVFSVAENVMLGIESVRRGRLDIERVSQRIEQLSKQYGLQVDPRATVKDLPVGVQQRVEILKVLYRNADILILDEPTAVLTPQEVDELFGVLRSLKAERKSIIFITHKLREVMDVADRITVMRDGKVVGTTAPAQTDRAELARMMVGRSVLLTVDKRPAKPLDLVLRVRDLKVADQHGLPAVNGVTFDVHGGEVLGVAGVQGNGQSELVEALTGLRRAQSGVMELYGRDVTHASPRHLTEAGVAYVPEDRQRFGLVAAYSVADNLILSTYYQEPFAHGLTVDNRAIEANAVKLIAEYDIRTPSPWLPTRNLSGGNQQKVIVAREFSRPNRLLIANQPTRGLDVGSIEYIHKELIDMRDQGCAVVLVSAELDEIMSLSDRIAVMYRGRLVAIMPAEQATREQLGLLMAGVSPDAQHAPDGTR
ncbi:MAG: ABC transporter ATP-binding protein [Chloroflexi bacterium]|nr:ABC transporter ATP-binding protein [Chloroflexota bacterium]